ncbi:unnamed protein product [Prorocentrum cordatum]|uniref:Core-binding (CB) domain-containing protein n=1 Tax=Prorocentrum cordatum TaxID=2364126 RepID=A0ABN9TYS2_9DINO|nr:unnamed protein product [Polarella glacialis]
MGRRLGIGGLATLKQESITPKTKQDYVRRLVRFDDFCKTHGLATATDDSSEEALVEYMDLLFSRGKPSNLLWPLLRSVSGPAWSPSSLCDRRDSNPRPQQT